MSTADRHVHDTHVAEIRGPRNGGTIARTEQTGFPGGSDDEEPACRAGDPGSISGLGRSPGEGHGNPLQYSYPKNPMDGGAWWHSPWGHKEGSQDSAHRFEERYGCWVVWSVYSGQLRPAVTSQCRTFQNPSPRGHPRSPLAHAGLCAAAAPLTGELGVPFRSRALLLLPSDSTLLLLLCVCVCV